MKKKIFLFLVLSLLGVSFASAATWTVCPSGCNYATIQAAINAATTLPGDIIRIGPGTYAENVVINKHITLDGAGPSSTIIHPASGKGIKILASGSGISASDRTVISNLEVTQAVDAGIYFDATTGTISYITLQNVQTDHNLGDGIYFYGVPANVLRNIILYNVTSTYNRYQYSNLGGIGVNLLSGPAIQDGLTIIGGTYAHNERSGLHLYRVNASLLYIDGATFDSNSIGVDSHSDIIVNTNIPFTNFTMANVHITGAGENTGMRIEGAIYTSTKPYTPLVSAGNIIFDNILIDGEQKVAVNHTAGSDYNPWGPYPVAAMAIERFNDVSNIKFNNVYLFSTAPNGLFVGSVIGTVPLHIRNTVFNGLSYNQTIRLGLQGNNPAYVNATDNVDAREATFIGIPCPIIPYHVWDQVDDPALGLVLLNPCPECGDGNLDTEEECDDGNLINGDGCSSVCTLENQGPGAVPEFSTFGVIAVLVIIVCGIMLIERKNKPAKTNVRVHRARK